MILPPPISTLFPYTTLFRSHNLAYLRSFRRRANSRRLALSLLDSIFGSSYNDCGSPNASNIESKSDSANRSEEHTSELQSRVDLVCRLLLEKKNNNNSYTAT